MVVMSFGSQPSYTHDVESPSNIVSKDDNSYRVCNSLITLYNYYKAVSF
jgi:hypothetical protein